ncbi:MAG: PcfJ domain-containing protein, partial [Planctomycetota bacterium]
CEALARLRLERPHRTQLGALFEIAAKRSGFLFEHETFGERRLPYWRGLVALNDRRGQWLRPLDEWRPQSHNRRKQFAHLARHLLADYHVPGFLDAAWLRDDQGSHRYRDLFVHIGRGGNPRTEKLPIPMGKKVAHWFLQAPDHVSIEGALRWGQVHALGGGPRLAEAIAATPLGREFEHEAFWQTVLAWFVQHAMLDTAQVGPIVDFLTHMKFRPREVVLADGRVEQQPPPQPGLTMARRNPEALLQQMQRWHAALGGDRGGGPELWASTGIGALRWETGLKNRRLWSIDELRTRKALVAEGRAMGHCVATYAGSCNAGRCSIWAVALTTKEGVEKRLTVELSRQRVIVQARGKHNRTPEPQELDVLRRWAEQEELTLATYL